MGKILPTDSEIIEYYQDLALKSYKTCLIGKEDVKNVKAISDLIELMKLNYLYLLNYGIVDLDYSESQKPGLLEKSRLYHKNLDLEMRLYGSSEDNYFSECEGQIVVPLNNSGKMYVYNSVLDIIVYDTSIEVYFAGNETDLTFTLLGNGSVKAIKVYGDGNCLLKSKENGNFVLVAEDTLGS